MRVSLGWRPLVRRWLGPSEVETELRATVADLTATIARLEEWQSRDRADRDQAYQRPKLAEKALRHIQREVLDRLMLVEPPETEGCVKARLHTEADPGTLDQRRAWREGRTIGQRVTPKIAAQRGREMIDRCEVAPALANVIAYKNCGNQTEAERSARELVVLLECADILRPDTSNREK